MIVALSPNGAEAVYIEVRSSLVSAGLLSAELEDRIDHALEGASSARATTSTPAVEIARFEIEGDAAELATELIEANLVGVEVRQVDGEFVVLVTDIASAELAELVRATFAPTGLLTAVPDVYGLTESEALHDLSDAGFTDVIVWRVHAPDNAPRARRNHPLLIVTYERASPVVG